jgi:hypothetical protein
MLRNSAHASVFILRWSRVWVLALPQALEGPLSRPDEGRRKKAHSDSYPSLRSQHLSGRWWHRGTVATRQRGIHRKRGRPSSRMAGGKDKDSGFTFARVRAASLKGRRKRTLNSSSRRLKNSPYEAITPQVKGAFTKNHQYILFTFSMFICSCLASKDCGNIILSCSMYNFSTQGFRLHCSCLHSRSFNCFYKFIREISPKEIP